MNPLVYIAGPYTKPDPVKNTHRMIQIADRLMDLGVVPGTPVEVEMRSMGGDPVAYRVRGALIALRAEQAGWIEVEPLPAAMEA